MAAADGRTGEGTGVPICRAAGRLGVRARDGRFAGIVAGDLGQGGGVVALRKGWSWQAGPTGQRAGEREAQRGWGLGRARGERRERGRAKLGWRVWAGLRGNWAAVLGFVGRGGKRSWAGSPGLRPDWVFLSFLFFSFSISNTTKIYLNSNQI